MGSATGYQCQACWTRFEAEEGGGFFFDLLHCDRCGRTNSVAHSDMGDAHLAYVKGLKTPYAIARAEMDREIQRTYAGQPLTEAAYHAAVERQLPPCACGGRFTYAARPRCPHCGSTEERWTATGERAFYD
jgi:DNA-directed RNA polymerase subunit RPC12/RpoP